MKSKTFNATLIREIGLLPATMLVVGNTVGTGIFTTSGFIVKELRDPGALLLVWILGGIVALFGALSYSKLGRIFPKAGGEYAFLKETFGTPFGFLAGWVSLIVGFSAPIAATSIAFSKYFLELFKVEDFEIYFNFSLSKFVAICTILVLSLIHLHKISVGVNFQTAITLSKILFILVLITFGFLLGKEEFNSLRLEELIPSKEAIFNQSFPVSLIYVMYAYSGWNASTYVGEEIKNPQRNIPLSLILGTLIVILLYLGLNLLYIRTLSIDEMAGVLEVGAKSVEKMFGNEFYFVFTGGITIGLLSVLSAMIMAGPRVYYAMARDGVFFKSFSKVNPYTGTPTFSILFQAMIAILMVLTSTFEALILYIGFTLSLCSSLTVAGLFKIKKKLDLLALIFILVNLWMVLFTVFTKPITLLWGTLTILTGLLLYFLFLKFKNY